MATAFAIRHHSGDWLKASHNLDPRRRPEFVSDIGDRPYLFDSAEEANEVINNPHIVQVPKDWYVVPVKVEQDGDQVCFAKSTPDQIQRVVGRAE